MWALASCCPRPPSLPQPPLPSSHTRPHSARDLNLKSHHSGPLLTLPLGQDLEGPPCELAVAHQPHPTASCHWWVIQPTRAEGGAWHLPFLSLPPQSTCFDLAGRWWAPLPATSWGLPLTAPPPRGRVLLFTDPALEFTQCPAHGRHSPNGF